MNRSQRRAAARHDRRRKVTALGSAAILASAGAGAAVVLTSTAASANATIVVDSLTDDGTGGLTLREAIEQANTDPGQDEITFSVTGTITLASNLPAITEAVHIHGPGASSLTIDGATTYRVFSFDHIYEGTDEVTDLTITHGNSDGNNPDDSGGAIQVYFGDTEILIADVVLTDNYSSNDGGAINFYSFDGVATVTRATVTNNIADEGGGGLYADGDTGMTITITDSTFSGNTAGDNGGGLYFSDGVTSATITNTVITNNTSAAGGGGVHSGGSHLYFNGGEISGNTALYGGAVNLVSNSSLRVLDATVANNTAGGSPGGGGVHAADSDLTIVSSTVSGNTSGWGGGGVKITGVGNLGILDSTISGNSTVYYGGGLYLTNTGTVDIFNSTISGNSGSQAGGVYAGNGTGVQIAQSTITANHAGVPGTLPAIGGIQIGGGEPIITSNRARHAPARVREARPNEHGKVPTQGQRAGVAAPLTPGHLQLSGVIVAGNRADNDLDLGADGPNTVQVASDHSIIGVIQSPNVVVTDLGGTQSGVAAEALKLGPLADNGGSTPTHALLEGSPAVDAGPNPIVDFPGNTFDQRGEGYDRIVNGKVDVGAFEVQPPAPEPTPEPTFTG